MSPLRPPTSLVGLSQFSSIVLQLGLVAITQFGAVVYLHSQDWFVEHNITAEETDNEDYVCHDNYALFIVQIFQYVTLVIIFSKGAPYRKAFYTNSRCATACVCPHCNSSFTLQSCSPWQSC